MRKLALIVLLAALLQNAAGQRMAAAPHFASGSSAFGHHSFSYPIPFLTDGFYSDAVYTGYAAGQPTIVLMQAPTPAQPERIQPPAQPLLIELRGDRYVRISGEEMSGAQMIEQDSGSIRKPDAVTNPAAAREPTSTVLVFRDGRSEEVSDYTIVEGILYARRNYYTDGSWNRKIELSSLNLTETVAVNRSRGLKFQLPSASNEVIVGP
jgi:hypothetical protein